MKAKPFLFLVAGIALLLLTTMALELWGNAQAQDPELQHWMPLYGGVPVGTIVAWANSLQSIPQLPRGWARCNGQVLSNPSSPLHGQVMPDLNHENRFLRGSVISGGTGGQAYNTLTKGGYDTHSSEFPKRIDGKYQGTISNEPPYYDVVWIIKVL